MGSIDHLPSGWLLLDIERRLSEDNIRELALITAGDKFQPVNPDNGQLDEAIDRIERARVIVGHNLRRHDIPHLYRLAGRQQPEGLEERLCDTLELSSLFLVGQATHSLTKLYREEKGLSDPVEDAIESYEVYQHCQANNRLPILVRYWATRLLPDRYLGSAKQVVTLAFLLLVQSGLHGLASLLLEDYRYLYLSIRFVSIVSVRAKNFGDRSADQSV